MNIRVLIGTAILVCVGCCGTDNNGLEPHPSDLSLYNTVLDETTRLFEMKEYPKAKVMLMLSYWRTAHTYLDLIEGAEVFLEDGRAVENTIFLSLSDADVSRHVVAAMVKAAEEYTK